MPYNFLLRSRCTLGPVSSKCGTKLWLFLHSPLHMDVLARAAVVDAAPWAAAA